MQAVRKHMVNAAHDLDVNVRNGGSRCCTTSPSPIQGTAKQRAQIEQDRLAANTGTQTGRPRRRVQPRRQCRAQSAPPSQGRRGRWAREASASKAAKPMQWRTGVAGMSPPSRMWTWPSTSLGHSTSRGYCPRISDDSNWWRFGTDRARRAQKRVAGTITSPTTTGTTRDSVARPRPGDRLCVVAKGNTITCYRNNEFVPTITDSHNATAQRIENRGSGCTGPRRPPAGSMPYRSYLGGRPAGLPAWEPLTPA
ncbi:hypothetical protein QF047_000802 [Arthrobacter sp. W4I7]|nr:hypothetical protein [Arthrobacter sp. W4I7]